ncbi:hypothetical protein FRC07_004732 [Ceratobasidium sp. 392]|nr:hypothetical protein FRC07_004732 [Ceratobasidium sp. 392]
MADSGLEESLVYVDSALASLDTWPSRVRDARTILSTVRNRSRSLVPFNRLPTEIIAHTLSLIETDCIVKYRLNLDRLEHRPFRLANLFAVSKWMRSVITNTPSLWTHVDLALGLSREATYMSHARACLKYSEQQSLHVHIADSEGKLKAHQGVSVINLLAPHAHRIASVGFHVTQRLAGEMVLGIFSGTASYRARELCLNDCKSKSTTPGPPCYYDGLFDGRLDGLLQDLQVVKIRGPSPPLQSVAFRGLIVLKLLVYETASPRPTLLQFRNVLAGCPELRVLTLAFPEIRLSTETPVEPVYLPKLELLDLRHLDTNPLLSLLSFITSGSSTLALSIWADPFMAEDDVAILHHFIDQSNITRLLLESPCYPGDVSSPPALLGREFPTVRELALCDYDLEELANTYPLDLDRFPSLRTLHVLQCYTEPRNWRQLVNNSTIQVAYIDNFGYEQQSVLNPPVEHRKYSATCQGDEDFEWPLYDVHR